MTTGVTGMSTLLQVFDMPTSAAFYCDVLGFKLVRRSQEGQAHFDWCMLELDGTYLMLNTRYERDERPPAPDPLRVAHHDDVGLYYACSDVEAVYRRLRDKGAAVAPPQRMHYGAKEIWLKDPDGSFISRKSASPARKGSGATNSVHEGPSPN